MFCKTCGNQVKDGTPFCPSCGAQMNVGFNSETVNNAFNNAENQFRDAVNDVAGSFNGSGTPPYRGERLQTDRSLFTYIVLSLITCGIYGYYFLYKMAKDVNVACEGDGEKTAGLIQFIVLSTITCGIYAYFWYYNLGNRLAANAPRYGMNFQENGTTVLLWCLFGAFLCGIGPFVAMNILIKNTNKICYAYNSANGL